jgi:hypothetical protein
MVNAGAARGWCGNDLTQPLSLIGAPLTGGTPHAGRAEPLAKHLQSPPFGLNQPESVVYGLLWKPRAACGAGA